MHSLPAAAPTLPPAAPFDKNAHKINMKIMCEFLLARFSSVNTRGKTWTPLPAVKKTNCQRIPPYQYTHAAFAYSGKFVQDANGLLSAKCEREREREQLIDFFYVG